MIPLHNSFSRTEKEQVWGYLMYCKIHPLFVYSLYNLSLFLVSFNLELRAIDHICVFQVSIHKVAEKGAKTSYIAKTLSHGTSFKELDLFVKVL
ncbi:hypothetical protein Hanom_Chr12g01158961 [Helianthus anomalus]